MDGVRSGWRLVVLVAVVTATLAALAAMSRAAGGRIAFVSERDGNREIYTADADGTSVTRITDSALVDGAPAWSPDGTRIAFDRDGEIWVMRADGSDADAVVTSIRGFAPTWSPDGSRLAFQGDGPDDDWEVWTVAADGTGLSQLTDNAVADQYPDWGSAGIVVVRDSTDVVVVDPVSGSDVAGTTVSGPVRDPHWHPDGNRVVMSQAVAGGWRLVVLDLATDELTALTVGDGVQDRYPAWSPDGATILFARDPDHTGPEDFDLWTVTADGVTQTRITTDDAHDFQPAFQPGAAAPDTTAPTWPSGSLTVTAVADQEVSLSWSGATDDVAVTGYEVSRDGVVVATVPATQTTYDDSGLQPGTTYHYEVQATDAAGNVSVDGPTLDVTTTGVALPSGHLGPDPADPSLAWTGALPFSALEHAHADGEVLLIASSGAHPPVVTQLPLLTPQDVDVDGDGTTDLTATVSLDAPSFGDVPVPVLDVERQSALTDVEVLTVVPVADDSSEEHEGPPFLVVGFRTVHPSTLGAGGMLPGREVLSFEAAGLTGLSHDLGLRFETVNPAGPLRFLVGVVEGDARGALNANLVSALVEDVPTMVDVGFHTDLSDLAAPEPSLDATLTWDSPAGEPRTPVTFSYLESEQDPATQDQYGTTVTFEPMAHSESLRLLLDPATEDLTLEHAADAVTDEIRVDHRRVDGTHVVGRLVDAPTAVTATVGDEITVDPQGDVVGLDVEVHLPTGDLLDGMTGHPIRHLIARLVEARQLRIALDDSGGLAFDVETPGSFLPAADLLVVAADDDTDLRLPSSQTWPAGHPRGWAPASTSDGLLRIGVVDDQAGSTVALRAHEVAAVGVDLDPQDLSQAFDLTLDETSDVDVVAELAAGTPITGAIPATVGCTGRFLSGTLSLIVEPPSTYGLRTGSPHTPRLDCTGVRGSTEATLSGTGWPASVAITLDPATGPTGGLTTEILDLGGHPDTLSTADIVLRDDSGLTGPQLLGVPATEVGVRAVLLPSAEATWTNDEAGPHVTMTSLAPEDPIGALHVTLSTSRSAEPFSPAPPPGHNATSVSGASMLRLWDTPAGVRLAARAAGIRQLTAGYEPGAGTATVDLEQQGERSFVADLALPSDGVFSLGRAVDGWCRLQTPDGFAGAQLRLPEQATLTTPETDGFGRLHCELHVTQSPRTGREFDVDVEVDSGRLPPTVEVHTTPGRRVLLDVPDGTVEWLGMVLEDASGNGLPAEPVLGHPIGGAAVRLDEVPSSSVTWSGSPDEVRVHAAVEDPATSIGALQTTVSSNSSLSMLSSPAGGHHVGLTDNGPDGSMRFDARVAGLVEAAFGSSSSPAAAAPDVVPRLRAELTTDGPHTLTADVDLDFDSAVTAGAGLSIEGDATINAVPEELTWTTDLEGWHELIANTVIGGLDAHVEIDDDPAGGELLTIEATATGIPVELTLDLDELTVTADGVVGEVDVVANDPRAPGVFGLGPNRIRLRGEQIPVSLTVDHSGLAAGVDLVSGVGGDAMAGLDGTAQLRLDLGGRAGRVRMEADDVHASSEQPNLFGAPYSRLIVDAHGIPQLLEVAVSRDAGTGEVTATARGSDGLGDPAVPTTGDSVDRLEVVLERNRTHELHLDPGAMLHDLTHSADSRIVRSGWVQQLDNGYWPAGVRQRLDALMGDPVTLPTTTVTRPAAPDGREIAETIAPVDHVVIDEDAAGVRYASLRLSDLAAVEASLTSTSGVVTVSRSAGTTAGRLVVGRQTDAVPDYEGPEERTVPEHTEGDPDASNDDYVRNHDPAVDSHLIDVLRNDTPSGDDELDTSKLTVVAGPAEGTVTVEDGKLRYDPSAGAHFVGWDSLVYEVCDTAERCDRALVRVLIREPYEAISILDLQSQPDSLTLEVVGDVVGQWKTVNGDLELIGTEWQVKTVHYEASSSPGRLEVYDGPRTPPPISPLPRRARLQIRDLPTEATIDVSGLRDMLPGRLELDADGVVDLVGAVEHGTVEATTRTVFGLVTEDALVETVLDGSLVDGIDGTFSDSDFADCDRVFRSVGTCLRLFRIGAAAEGSGDITGTPTSGFVGSYRLTDLGTSPPGSAQRYEYTPRFTGMVKDFRTLGGSFEFQLEPFCTLQCELPPLDLEIALRGRSGRIDFDYWDDGFDLCVKILSSAHCVTDDPDYLSGDPWDVIAFQGGFDPYN